MTTIEIKVPSVGESVTEALLTQWFKQEADAVRKDEALFELETDKVTLEATAEAAGKLQEEHHFPDALDVRTILSLPGIIQVKETAQTEPSSALSAMVASGVREALEGVLRMRRQEGEALRIDMQKNLARIEENAGRIEQLSVNLASEHLQKLRDRLNQDDIAIPSIGNQWKKLRPKLLLVLPGFHIIALDHGAKPNLQGKESSKPNSHTHL